MTRAAMGFRAHSGWAALVVVAGSGRSTVVVERLRIDIADPRIPGSSQPYHAAEGLDLRSAEALLNRCAEEARNRAQSAVLTVVNRLRHAGHELVGGGLLLSSGRPLTTLAATLASHALIHTADGEHFREAITYAVERCDLPVTRLKEREVEALGASTLRIPVAELRERLSEMGRPLGPPWRQDEKLAALAAWLVLATPRSLKPENETPREKTPTRKTSPRELRARGKPAADKEEPQ